jgi:hypothetical protein
MIHMADRPDVAVRLVPLKLRFAHCCNPSVSRVHRAAEIRLHDFVGPASFFKRQNDVF